MIPPLFKHTIIVWSREDMSMLSLVDISEEANFGSAYCAYVFSEPIEDPEDDEYWDGTEFFDEEDDE